ncbi:hypothetical protein JQN72_10760 [Phycicoccus sp. CSK15P-2]|uniref:hypothetical protein n=1 Tax=Phycicoccus sp. CSK15P-2 TaxID=2807627 RepID=UPI00195209CD|nr:hypothetical protein [Phycicoccus sp. CSK15P-2]MBM6404722.1 hypothetical protein [Phycicoccus sp. CSK15P-2]
MSPVQLSEEELRFLRAAMLDWGGLLSPDDALAAALGFTDAESMSSEAWGLWRRIERREDLSHEDWRRVLLAAEVVFVSDVVGSGIDWSITSGIPDGEAISILRGLQRKLPRWRGSSQFRVDADEVRLTDPERPSP